MKDKIQMSIISFSESIIALSHDPETPFNKSSFDVLSKTMPCSDRSASENMYLEYMSFSTWMWWFNSEIFFQKEYFWKDLKKEFEKSLESFLKNYDFIYREKGFSAKEFYELRRDSYRPPFFKGDVDQVEKIFRHFIEQAWTGGFVVKRVYYPFEERLNLPIIEPSLFTKTFISYFFADLNRILKSVKIV